ncbi:cytidylyltransferase domain-containing protein [Streptomyces sp. NPDC020379]|uniref:cytidylyltransferase domain-containing protein n=1 Tax=Streptomyces sp. NPDC020379 TaxID=3365071 RepID=UPI0037A6CD38
MSAAPDTVLAVIPARGGSKGVPAKNLAPVGGVPLVARAVRACRAARLVTDVVVSTDDPGIAAVAREAGAVVVPRPSRIAGDTASSEAAVLHAMDAYEEMYDRRVGTVLLVQCTSPFLTADDIDGVASAVAEQGADTALTVAPFHGFVWREGSLPRARPFPRQDSGAQAPVQAGAVAGEPARPEPAPGPQEAAGPGHAPARPAGEDTAPRRGQVAMGRAAEEALGLTGGDGVSHAAATGSGDAPGSGAAPGHPAGGRGVNHDKAYRPRRQDRPQDLLETGAAYAMRAERFRAERHRFFGRTELVRTDPARVLEIDDPHDLARARALAPLLDAPAAGALPSLEDVDAVVMDFDGTQTDDRVLIDADGRELVAVHRGDGLGVAALRRAGLALLILSTEADAVVAARGRKLAVPVLHGIDRKDLALKQWCDERGIAPDRVLYVGNDVNDLPCFGLVGWPVAVASAHDAVRGAARAVTAAPGGSGALREIASWLLGPTL